jgi:hypothetical protein
LSKDITKCKCCNMQEYLEAEGCSIQQLERVLDRYARGDAYHCAELAAMQSHISTCEYCSRLLFVAEQLRSTLIREDERV